MKKKQSKAFNKDVYLLGKDEHGVRYWLEAPKWDCGWYWGFGYIETYTHKSPHLARDINSHEHATDFFPNWFGGAGKLVETTFGDTHGWELSELFKQFYFLRDCADNFKRGKCHVACSKIDTWEKPEIVKEVNELILPKVMKRITDILTP